MGRPDPSKSTDLARILAELSAIHELIASLHSRVLRLEGRAAPDDAGSADPVPDVQALRDEVADLGEGFLDRFEELVRRAGAVASSEEASAPVARAEGTPVDPGDAVRLDAGPFADLGALLDFERSLSSLPTVEDVNLRAFQAGRAILEVSTVRPAQIIEDLHSLPAPPLATELAANGTVVLTVSSVPTGEDEAPR